MGARRASARGLLVKPESGGNRVDWEAYNQICAALLDGLGSARATLAPDIARALRITTADVRECLRFSIGVAEKGSHVTPLHGSATGTAQLWEIDVWESFWTRVDDELKRAAQSQLSAISGTCAGAFARASSLGSKRGVRSVGIATRKGRGWSTKVDLSKLQAGLRAFADRRARASRVRHRYVGRIDTIRHDPPGLDLAFGGSTIKLTMSAALRTDARQLWGKMASVLVEVDMDGDGHLSAGKAIGIDAAPVDRDLKGIEALGAVADIEAKTYLKALLGSRRR